MINEDNSNFKYPADFSADEIKELTSKYTGWSYWPEPIISASPNIAGFEKVHMVDVPTVYQLPDDDKWYMSFIGFDGAGYQSFVAVSKDLVNWSDMRLASGYGLEGEFDHGGRVLGAFLYESYGLDDRRTLKKVDGKYWSLYGAYPRQGGYELRPGYEGLACSEDGIVWQRAMDTPILSIFDEDIKEWEKDCIYMPWLVEHEGQYFNYYNAANVKIEQTGIAISKDLKTWTRYENNPIVPIGGAGKYNEKFSSDAKVFKDGDVWVMLFFGVGCGGAHIMLAFSRDMYNWTVNSEPIYKTGGHPDGLDSRYAHKISIVKNPTNGAYYMHYCATGNQGRCIALLTSKPF